MPCLLSDALESMEPCSATPGASSTAGSEESFRRETVSEPPMVKSMGWFFSPLWSPRAKTRRWRFGDGRKNQQVEAWLDDHSDFTRAYFLRRSSAASGAQSDLSCPLLPPLPRSRSDYSELLNKGHQNRPTTPQSRSHLNISSMVDSLKPLNLCIPDGMDHFGSDPHGCYSPCTPRSPRSPRTPRCSFSPCQPLSPVCPCSPGIPQLLHPGLDKGAACGHGEGCPWMMELLRGGLSWMDSVAELCQGAVVHCGELLTSEGSSLSLVKKDQSGKSTLEEVVSLPTLGGSSENNQCSHAHAELVKGIMGCVLATGSTMNLRDTSAVNILNHNCSNLGMQNQPFPVCNRFCIPKFEQLCLTDGEDPRFDFDDDQPKIRTVLCVPIKSHNGEVVGVVVMINKKTGVDRSFTSMDEKVLTNHMDVLGMVLDNIQLYESSRQEAKRSQALIEMARVLSKEHHSFEILLSKMAATIMPFTHAQYCTIFIPREESPVTEDNISFSQVIHLECEELGSTCQIYRRERDISDVDPSYALRTLVAMETLNMSNSSEGSIKSLICCPVRNERSENVIAVCQLMGKRTRDSDDTEAFNRYDERLLEDLAVYCGLALQYVQAVQITEERRASIEVTQEVLAYHITAAEQEIQALQEATIPSAEDLCILDFHFSDFGLPEDLTTQATVRMFLDLNLVQDFNIDYKSLCQWVLTVRRGYRNNVPYHNWNHALSTAQSMFAILMATNQLQTIFSRLEILALMIATLNHDIDHRGVSNSYIERSQQPLAQLYGHSSLENHHYNLCLFILNNTGSQILSGLSKEDHKSVMHFIKRAILATDLTVFLERRKEFISLTKKSGVTWKSEKQRDLLRSMLMTASDLSAITKPWPEQRRIANLVATEFFAQGDKEKEEFKIDPIGIMNRENSTRLPFLQVEYIDEICYPLYKAVSRMFDTCSPLLSGCKKNRENWLHLTKDAEKDKYSEKSGDATRETNKKKEEET